MKRNLLVLFFSVMACLAGAQNAKTYTAPLVVTIDGESTEPQEASIQLEDLGDGTCNISLRNFSLVSGDDMMSVGNINVPGVTLTEEGGVRLLSADQVIQIAPGEPEEAGWLGPMLGDVPLKLTGKLTEEKLYCVIDIDMSSTIGQVINVQFGTDFADEPEPVAGVTYTDQLVVTIDGESTEPQEASIQLEDLGDGTCNISLRNFSLVSGDDVMPVGNINVPGVTLTEEGGVRLLSADQVIQIAPGEPEDDGWLGPMLGDVPLKLTGKLTEEKLYCVIDIDMSSTIGQVINVQFGTDFADEPEPVAGVTYTDQLVVTIDGESTEPQEASIQLEDLGDGTCNISLRNFSLVSGDDVMPVGNINVPGVTLTEEGGVRLLSADQVIQIAPGEPEDDGWLGPMLGDVPLKLTGKLTEEKLYCVIDIDMSSTIGQVINVQFGTDWTTDGIRAVAASAEGRVDVYTLNGVCVRRGVAAASALNGLQRGVYVVNGKKIIK